MNKNVLYLIATLLAVVIVALLFSGKQDSKTVAVGAALPTNGMIGGTTSEKAPTAASVAATPLPAAPAPSSDIVSVPTAPAAGSKGDADDVPAGAEVSGEVATPAPGEAPKPANDMTLPASEGQ